MSCLLLSILFQQNISLCILWVPEINSFKFNSSTSKSRHDLDSAIESLEEDATEMLQFMASNGLVANPTKTEFRILNAKDQTTPKKLELGQQK